MIFIKANNVPCAFFLKTTNYAGYWDREFVIKCYVT